MTHRSSGPTPTADPRDPWTVEDRRRALGRLLAPALALPLAGMAFAQAAPTGRVILTVTGAISRPNRGQDAVFDLRMLQTLPQVSHTVTTPWYPRKVTFQGPLARAVLAQAGVQGSRVKAIAINDYSVEIPIEDFHRHDVILALLMNGKPMSPRDKGPLFVIYPYDRLPPQEQSKYHDRSVWQLDTLAVLR